MTTRLEALQAKEHALKTGHASGQISDAEYLEASEALIGEARALKRAGWVVEPEPEPEPPPARLQRFLGLFRRRDA